MKLHLAFFLRVACRLIFLVVLTKCVSAQCLDSCYHTRAEIDSFLIALRDYDAVHNHIVHIDTIGWSRGDMLGIRYPIYSVKISSSPNTFVDQPTALLIGHIHAEEVLGLETVLDLIWKMVVTQYGRYGTLIQNTQMYIVPTMNPAGLEMINRNWDCTLRKNDYWPPTLDTCIIVPGSGGDSCGVDLNRNFDLNWIYGDTLWQPGALERYDYYRGPAPFSEPESRAIRDLAISIKPTVSAVFHLSRSGLNSERCIGAWCWEEVPNGPAKASPDCTAIGYMDNLYVYEFPFTEVGERYHEVLHLSRNGELQDWFYRNLGTIQFNTELGPHGPNIQPDCHTRDSLVARYDTACVWLLNRMLNLGHVVQAPVTIHTYSGPTNDTPISAEWRYLNTWSSILDPWYTNEQFGSATTLLAMQGTARFLARKEGFADTIATITVYNNDPQYVNIHLRPLPWHNLALRLYDGTGSPISGRVYLDAEFPRWVDVSVGGVNVNLPEGNFRAMAVGDGPGHMVLWRNFYLGGDGTQQFYLPYSNQRFVENFEGGLGNWIAGGTGNPWRLDMDTTAMGFGNCLCNAPAVYRGQYADNLNATLTYNAAIPLGSDTNNVAYMTLWRRGRLDMPADSFFVEVISNYDTAPAVVAGYSDLELPWTQSWINLTPWMGQSIHIFFRFQTDGVMGDLGLDIDNVAIFTGMDLTSPENHVGVTYTYRITGSYPNPFNPSTTITYEVAAPGEVKLVLFNTLGQEVRRFDVNAVSVGAQRLMWDGKSADGSPVAAGLYFVQLQAGRTVSTHKLLLLR